MTAPTSLNCTCSIKHPPEWTSALAPIRLEPTSSRLDGQGSAGKQHSRLSIHRSHDLPIVLRRCRGQTRAPIALARFRVDGSDYLDHGAGGRTMDAADAVDELTLMLMYLTSWRERD